MADEKKKFKSRKLIYFIIIVALLCVSLFWSGNIELILHLKPDLKDFHRDGDFEVHFVDVGQGDCIAMRFSNGKTMLVDSGPSKAESDLKTYLNKVFFNGYERKFDYVLLTHSDADHSGNMEFVLHNYAVDTFYRPYIFNENEGSTEGYSLATSKIEQYTKVINYLKTNKIKTEFFKAETQIIVGDDILIDFYAPVDVNAISNTNDFSPIMVVSDNNKLVCLTGDASTDIEESAMGNYTLPDIDLLKLGHHGSKYSTSMAFLVALQPEYVVAQVGTNTYGHPSSDVLNRLAEYDEEYDKYTYSGFLNNKDDDNIIFHVLEGESDFVINTIADMDSFVFMDWYIVVIIASGILAIVMFVPKTKKYTKRKKTKSKNKNA